MGKVAVYIGFSGCKVNQFEKSLLAEQFLQHGFSVTSSYREADIIVYNTCCVTKKAETGCLQAINRYHRENPMAKIVVTGCFAEKDREKILSLPFVSHVVGNKEKNSIASMVAGAETEASIRLDFEFKHTFKERNRAVLKIQDGCDNFCSYCIVPFVRGEPHSMEKSLVIKNLWLLKHEKEVTLTGIHLGKWGKEFGLELSDLMKEIKKENFPFRVRLSSLDPLEINDRLLDTVRGMENFCPHFHISLQSGSDKILALMNRHYKTADFLAVVDKIRTIFPDAGIGIDLIVGFPGEDEKAFVETEELIKKSQIDYMHVFPYSRREGTKAAGFEGQVPQPVKLERAKIMKTVDAEKRKAFLARFNNKRVLCLADRKEGGFYRAVTREYLKVYSREKPPEAEFKALVTDTASGIAIVNLT